MHAQHKRLLTELKRSRRQENAYFDNDSYLSSGHTYYDVSVPERRRIAKEWLKANKNIGNDEFIAVVSSLFRGKSHEEKTLASILLGYHTTGRKAVRVEHLDTWLDELVGWAEVDSLCQNVFTADQVLGNWQAWKRFITQLAKSENVNKRRAALVFLTGPTHYSQDERLRNLAFSIIDTLKHEKPILITKAISWLLREMVAQHRKEVAAYIKHNEETLPKIAIRETRRKLETGKKNS